MNFTPPHCPRHGDLVMPMLRPGCWWCPTGEHLLLQGGPMVPPPTHRQLLTFIGKPSDVLRYARAA